MLAIILAAFLSQYTNTGDFPNNDYKSMPKILKKTDKNAIIALSAGLGELHNGMKMQFGGDPTRETALAPYSALVRKCKDGTLSYEMLPSSIFPAMIDGFAAIKAANYYQSYTNGVTNITILGVSPFMMDFYTSTAYARDLVNDVKYEYYSNMFEQFGVDYAIFREVGARTPYQVSRYGRTPTMYDVIHDEYVRVLGSGAATNVTASGFCCENLIVDYALTPVPWGREPSETAEQSAKWRACGCKFLCYAPMTAWNMLGPQNFGMVYRWDGDMVGVVTTTRVWKAYCDIDVTYTPTISSGGRIVGSTFDWSSHNTSNTVQYTVTTNWYSGTAHLENWSRLDAAPPLLGFSWSSAAPLTNQQGIVSTALIATSDPYELTTNGVTYRVQDPGLVPVFSNSTSAISFSFIASMAYTTVKSGIIHVPYDSDFPQVDAGWNSPVVSSIVKVDVSGENWSWHDVSSSRRLAYNPQMAHTCGTLAYIAGDTIAPLRTDCASEFAALAENCDASPVWDETSGSISYDVIGPDEMPNRFWWVYNRDESGLTEWTEDFEEFTPVAQTIPAMPGSVDIGLSPTSYPNDHECEMALKMAVFGYWRFTRWAYK